MYSKSLRPNLCATSASTIGLALIVSAAPLLLLAFNTDWFFTPSRWTDAYTFQGFFWHYTDPNFASDNYKVSRLPWILIGFAFHHLIPSSVAAAGVLHATCLLISIWAMFWTVLLLFESVALATLVGLLLGFHTYFHGIAAAGWEYHNVPGGSLLLLMLLVITRAALSGGSRTAYLAIGALATICVLTSPLTINLIPLLAIYALALQPRSSLGRKWISAQAPALAWVGLGGLLTIGILMAVNGAVGRDANFLFPEFRFILRRLGDNPDHLPFAWDWLSKSAHLALPFAVALASLVVLSMPSSAPHSARCRLLAALYLMALGMWSVWQALGQQALVPEYFLYPVLPFCFLALAGFLHFASRAQFGFGVSTVLLITVPALVLPLCIVDASGFAARLLAPLTASPLMLSAILIVGAFSLCAALPNNRLGFACCIALLGVANATTPWRHYYAYTAPCQRNANGLHAVGAATKAIERLSPSLRNTRIWFDEGEKAEGLTDCPMRLAHLAESIASANASYLAPNHRPEEPPAGEYFSPKVLRTVVPHALDTIPEEAIREAADMRLRVVVISREPEKVVQLQQRFSAANVPVQFLGRQSVRAGSIEFEMAAFQVSPRPEPCGTFASTCRDVKTRGSELFAVCLRNPTLLERIGSRARSYLGFASTRERWRETRLDFSGCVSEISTRDGVLTCDGRLGTTSVRSGEPGL